MKSLVDLLFIVAVFVHLNYLGFEGKSMSSFAIFAPCVGCGVIFLFGRHFSKKLDCFRSKVYIAIMKFSIQ